MSDMSGFASPRVHLQIMSLNRKLKAMSEKVARLQKMNDKTTALLSEVSNELKTYCELDKKGAIYRKEIPTDLHTCSDLIRMVAERDYGVQLNEANFPIAFKDNMSEEEFSTAKKRKAIFMVCANTLSRQYTREYGCSAPRSKKVSDPNILLNKQKSAFAVYFPLDYIEYVVEFLKKQNFENLIV